MTRTSLKVLLALMAGLFGANMHGLAQYINGYARVSAISGTTLTIAEHSEIAGTFNADDQVILIQIQAATIGVTNNSVTFGSVGSISTAGVYEVLEVLSVSRTAGQLTSVVVKDPAANAFDLSDNARLQLVTFPKLDDPDFTTTGVITAPAWNGNFGGIVAFQVAGTLELRHTIHADGRGFRGGVRSADHGASNDCDNSVFRSNSSNHGEKGEGIHRRTVNNQRYSRAPMLNGGGGGSSHNGGGGGGGNFTAGGIGGAGWNNTTTGCNPSTSGMGGLGLSDYIDPNRVFFGGGGGGGQQNNTVSTDGEPGGGMIFIKATRITTPDMACSVRISADGFAGTTAGNDGAGGGGAGGAIVFQVEEFEVEDDCTLTVRANGGKGGDVNSSTHAGGGGGGQGTIVYSGPLPTENIGTFTLNGAGGCDNSSCTQSAASGQGPNNIGILTGMPSVLNATHIDLTVRNKNQKAQLEWMVVEASEYRAYPTRVERSRDLNAWLTVAESYTAPGIPNHAEDHPGAGMWYYRARVDDSNVNSAIRAIDIGYDGPLVRSYFPNPASEIAHIHLNGTHSGMCRVVAPDGRTVIDRPFLDQNALVLNLDRIAAGVYIIEVTVSDRREQLRLKVR